MKIEITKMYTFNNARSQSDRKSSNSVLIPDFVMSKLRLEDQVFAKRSRSSP